MADASLPSTSLHGEGRLSIKGSLDDSYPTNDDEPIEGALRTVCDDAQLPQPKELRNAQDVADAPVTPACTLHKDEPIEGASRQACDDSPDSKPQELTNAQDVADAPVNTACTLLDIQDMLDMQSLLAQYGQCSYYILASDTLVLHLEDKDARDHADKIKEGVDNIVRRRKKDKDVEIVITNDPCNTVLCSIGATLFVNDIKQTIGMYVDHGGLVYWVSTAHELLPMNQWKDVNYLREKTANMHLAESETSQVYLTSGCAVRGAVDVGRIRAPTPYACLSYNPLPGKKGKLLLHYVDVMVGPMPMFTSRVVSGSHISASSLHEVRECPECPSDTCRNPHHDRLVRQYAISEILPLQSRLERQYEYYDASTLMKKKLKCRPLGQEIISGEVISCQNCFCMRRRTSDAHPFVLSNVLAIQPTGRVPPKEGDSGSVWVLWETKTAVAITVGMGEVNLVRGITSVKVAVWFAALLDATFDAFCAAHPNVFLDRQAIKPIVPLPPPAAAPPVEPQTSHELRATDLTRSRASSSIAADSGFHTSQLSPNSNN